MAKPPLNPQERYYRHIRFIKRVLRPLPRRALLHEYPFIKWFASAARKRPYLWSFRQHEVVLAIFIGAIIAFTPLYGFHIPGAFLFAFLLRSNLAITIAMQLIANNPFTALPLLALDYEIGFYVFKFFNKLPHGIHSGGAKECVNHVCSTHSIAELFSKGTDLFWMMTIGGLIAGLIFSFGFVLIYKLLSWTLHQRYERIKANYLRYKQKQQHTSTPSL